VPEYAVLTVNEATLPQGIVPKQNPVSVHFYTEFASALLIHVPDEVETLTRDEREAGAPPQTRLEIAAVVCQEGFAAGDDLDACAGQPARDFRFEVWQPENPGTFDAFAPDRRTDDAGLTGFNTVGYGEGTLRTIGASPRAEPEGYAVAEVRCARVDDAVVREASRLPHEPGTTVEGREVPFAPGDDLRCDWYFVPR